MAKKKIMYQLTYIIELDEEALKENGEWVIAELKLQHEMKLDGEFALNWESSSMKVLDSSQINCGRCARCGSWVSD